MHDRSKKMGRVFNSVGEEKKNKPKLNAKETTAKKKKKRYNTNNQTVRNANIQSIHLMSRNTPAFGGQPMAKCCATMLAAMGKCTRVAVRRLLGFDFLTESCQILKCDCQKIIFAIADVVR